VIIFILFSICWHC